MCKYCMWNKNAMVFIVHDIKKRYSFNTNVFMKNKIYLDFFWKTENVVIIFHGFWWISSKKLNHHSWPPYLWNWVQKNYQSYVYILHFLTYSSVNTIFLLIISIISKRLFLACLIAYVCKQLSLQRIAHYYLFYCIKCLTVPCFYLILLWILFLKNINMCPSNLKKKSVTFLGFWSFRILCIRDFRL